MSQNRKSSENDCTDDGIGKFTFKLEDKKPEFSFLGVVVMGIISITAFMGAPYIIIVVMPKIMGKIEILFK